MYKVYFYGNAVGNLIINLEKQNNNDVIVKKVVFTKIFTFSLGCGELTFGHKTIVHIFFLRLTHSVRNMLKDFNK